MSSLSMSGGSTRYFARESGSPWLDFIRISVGKGEIGPRRGRVPATGNAGSPQNVSGSPCRGSVRRVMCFAAGEPIAFQRWVLGPGETWTDAYIREHPLVSDRSIQWLSVDADDVVTVGEPPVVADEPRLAGYPDRLRQLRAPVCWQGRRQSAECPQERRNWTIHANDAVPHPRRCRHISKPARTLPIVADMFRFNV